ncbi:MAG: L-2-hydroxyglutarate oxidase, partial [Acidobacteria bacterium]|nr:L-2-hydroxyglutarate oxidase [Acidobacteriota bacterium]
MEKRGFEVVVLGGGVVGLATALAVLEMGHRSVLVLEAEDRLAAHQSGRNSGVIHAGLYYKPGSLKARTCTAGRLALEAFCEDHGVPYRRCGKLVVATREEELARLEELERRGEANGLVGMERLDAQGIRHREPAVRGIAGLWVPQTGVVDFREVARAYAEEIHRRGGEVRTASPVGAVRRRGKISELSTPGGTVEAELLVNCCGLWSDRMARRCGVEPEVRIVPFRGEYLELVPERRSLIRGLVYPVPDPRFPFLDVHFTRRYSGEVEAGPNAVLALARAGYRWRDVSLRDAGEVLTNPGFWRLARRYWRTGLGEMYRSLSRRASLKALQRLVPELRQEDLKTGGSGVRAQALDRQGNLLDDFRISQGEGSIHVLNAPSPAATASLA